LKPTAVISTGQNQHICSKQNLSFQHTGNHHISSRSVFFEPFVHKPNSHNALGFTVLRPRAKGTTQSILSQPRVMETKQYAIAHQANW
jgi:hypothetical protein